MSQVDHPAHYNQHPSGVEAITLIENVRFNLGNAIKYLYREAHKSGETDKQKAAWYIKREVERLRSRNVEIFSSHNHDKACGFARLVLSAETPGTPLFWLVLSILGSVQNYEYFLTQAYRALTGVNKL